MRSRPTLQRILPQPDRDQHTGARLTGLTGSGPWGPIAITATSTSAAQRGCDDEDRGQGRRLHRYMRDGSKAALAMNTPLDHAAASECSVHFVDVGDGFDGADPPTSFRVTQP